MYVHFYTTYHGVIGDSVGITSFYALFFVIEILMKKQRKKIKEKQVSYFYQLSLSNKMIAVT